jgi:hypothetical protein
VLWRAWVEERIAGSPGIDGVSIEGVERHGVKAYLGQLAEDLKAPKGRPRPAVRAGGNA